MSIMCHLCINRGSLKSSAMQVLGADIKVILFGSRLDNTAKGGDIDIFVQSQQNVSLRDQLKILAKIERDGIQRKVDLVVKTPHTPYKPIFVTIRKGAVVL